MTIKEFREFRMDAILYLGIQSIVIIFILGIFIVGIVHFIGFFICLIEILFYEKTKNNEVNLINI